MNCAREKAESMSDLAAERIHHPAPGEAQLTIRALLAGGALGGLLAVMNLYAGLTIGLTVGGSLMITVLALAFFSALRVQRRYSALEANITQTMGSAAGAMASATGLLAPLPAMALAGVGLSAFELIVWSLTITYLGVFLASALRRHFILVEKLTFPSGTATARTIASLTQDAEEAVAQTRVLSWFGAATVLWSALVYFLPEAGTPPLALAWSGFATLATWTMVFSIEPLLFGVGALIGPAVSMTLLAGAILAWGVLGPLAVDSGWTSDDVVDLTGVWGWLLWPGIGLVLVESLISLFGGLTGLVRGLRARNVADESGDDIPQTWWAMGMLTVCVAICLVATTVFSIPLGMVLLGLVLSVILAVVAAYSTGMTDINPAAPVGSLTQVATGAMAPSLVDANLMTSSITIAGASQAGDLMQDFKTGYLIGASPRRQFIAQILGSTVGVAVVVPFYLLIESSGKLATGELAAPFVRMYASVSRLVSHGLSSIPSSAIWAMAIAATIGGILALLRRTGVARWAPSGLILGLAFMVPASMAIAIAMGALLSQLWKRRAPAQHQRFVSIVACALIAGASIAGVGTTLMQLYGVPTFTDGMGNWIF